MSAEPHLPCPLQSTKRVASRESWGWGGFRSCKQPSWNPPEGPAQQAAHLLHVQGTRSQEGGPLGSQAKGEGRNQGNEGRAPDTCFWSLSSKSRKEVQKITLSSPSCPRPDWGVVLLTSSCFSPRKISPQHQTLITFPRDSSCGYF